jgi:hypothetical protein
MTYANDWARIIVDNLQRPDVDRVNETLNGLIEENFKLGNPMEGFLFRGKFWTTLPKKEQNKAPKRMLHPDLHESAIAVINEFRAIEREAQILLQGLRTLFADCQSSQDIRDALPDSVVLAIPEFFEGLSRTRPEGWPYLNKPLQMEQYKYLTEKLSFYVVNRMLY